MFQPRAIYLLCTLSLPLLSALAWYVCISHALKSKVKAEILAGNHIGQLQQLRFSINEARGLQWKHKFEFKYQGEMYDIWRTDFSVDSVTYHCVKDEKEMYLLHEIKKSVFTILGHPASRTNHEMAISHFIKSLCLPPPLMSWTSQKFHKISAIHVFNKRLLSIFSEVEDKPPACAHINISGVL